MSYKGFDLTGKVAAITGSTSGMGLEIARGLASCGAKVVLSSNDEDDTRLASASLALEGYEVAGVKCDITDSQDCKSFFDRSSLPFGPADILLCLAAAPAPVGPLTDTTQDSIDLLFSVVTNNILMAQRFLPTMAQRRYGSLIFMTSIASIRSNSVAGAYGAGKAALNSLARSIANEWGEHNVRGNAIAPGVVRTPFSRSLWGDPETERKFAAKSPANRIADPADIVGAAILLASPAGAYINGQTIVIDGGRSIV
jgi:NAD(P)-dependent dehydrogenase (short-subunit alcohol dehydrogenase family)